ncbi:unnamed protein product [Parnassius mnemosyne]|uniref:UDP-glucuronosyltransferase n=1 Tax=Parnassius mnemosyne TaxID=213953 RepID=A0AAV1LGS9_9NEOP
MATDLKCYLTIFLAIALYCDAYKILIFASMPGRSHMILGNGIARTLSKAGHEVTIITSFPKDKPDPNVREIDVGDSTLHFLDEDVNVHKILDKERGFEDFTFLFTMFKEVCIRTLENLNMQNILNNPKEKFDVIIAEWMFNELYAGLPAIFECPFIWFSTVEPHWMILKIIDELPNTAYNADVVSNNLPPLTFIQRVEELFYQIFGVLYQNFVFSPTENKDYERIIAPIVRRRGKPVPSFEELKNNISLVLGNSHVSIGQATRLPQSYKPIAGYHIEKEVKPLPQDLKKIIDNAKNGVIYFSMGSNIKSKELPIELKRSLLKVFGELKQTVIWKFEDNLPDRPKNVHIIQWAPQQSILAHPNCVLFITHGGFLSSTETIHFGVPIIGIPVYGDQFNNINRAVAKGYAKRVDLTYSLADDLKVAIDDILSDPKYKKRVKELSFIYHDRPVSPGDELVHWVEHVIRTGGALHLRSPALDVTWYKKMYLDLVAVIFIVFAIFILFYKLLIKKCMSSKCDIEKKRK